MSLVSPPPPAARRPQRCCCCFSIAQLSASCPSELPYKGKAANSSPEPLTLLFQVTISTTRGSWLLSRVFEHGYPWDMVLNTRLMSLIKTNLPRPLLWWLINYKLNQRFNHENYGLQPEKRYFLVAPIPCRWACGVGRRRYSATNIHQCPDWGDLQWGVCSPAGEDKL